MNGRARVSLLCLCVCDVILFSDRAQAQVYDYNVTIEAFTPRGFRISIPDDSRIKFFYIEYLLYKSNQFVNSSRQFVTEAKDGHRAVEDRNVTLSVGDVVRWTSFVALEWGDITPADQYGLNLEYHTSGVAKPYHNSIIREVVTRKNLVSPRTSNIIRTQVNNKEVAPNQVIFKDEFEGRALRRDLWHVAHYVPVDHPVGTPIRVVPGRPLQPNGAGRTRSAAHPPTVAAEPALLQQRVSLLRHFGPEEQVHGFHVLGGRRRVADPAPRGQRPHSFPIRVPIRDRRDPRQAASRRLDLPRTSLRTKIYEVWQPELLLRCDQNCDGQGKRTPE
ncbi:beta-1,3-glucan-binding protein-like isoform X2 [Leptidea sinapis]|uniref:beta-1,3-glucan-binding protein-like isoform X2 n=1 Tax=Leptidea sinapis TaxID=189913 RepID=UPI0021C37B0B|nr:beta-1,3-glucan-binding protein-like isoform X2 [Leptidea sinapis]